MKYYMLTYRCVDESEIKGSFIDVRWEVAPIEEISADRGDDFSEHDGYQEWREVYETREEAEEAAQDIADDHENVIFLEEEASETENAEKTKSGMKFKIGDAIKRTGAKAKWCPLRIVGLKIGNCASMNRYRTLKACVGQPVLDMSGLIPRYAESVGHNAQFLENKFERVF